MSILTAANSLWVNIALPVLIFTMVVLMPIIDIGVCRLLGINVKHGVGINAKTDQLLTARRWVLYVVFAAYLIVNAYLTFIARSSGSSYSIHIDPLSDVSSSITFDFGFGDFLGKLISGNFSEAFEQIHVVGAADIAQALMNISLYVPLGYLLPYVFEWFRKKLRRAVLFCFACSAFTENMQLIFKRGCYDFDDMIFNTIGGMIGVLLFRNFAYVVTHPNWRKEARFARKFRKTAQNTALFGLSKQMDCGRVTVPASDEAAIYHYFVEMLGFRPRGRCRTEEGGSTLLLELGGLHVEFVCSGKKEELPPRTVTLSTGRLDRVRKHLESNGIHAGEYFSDPYNAHRSMRISAPDNVSVVFTEY